MRHSFDDGSIVTMRQGPTIESTYRLEYRIDRGLPGYGECGYSLGSPDDGPSNEIRLVELVECNRFNEATNEWKAVKVSPLRKARLQDSLFVRIHQDEEMMKRIDEECLEDAGQDRR